MNILLICFLSLTPIDTIPIKYLTNQTWNEGYLVETISKKDEVSMVLNEPFTWLTSKKEPIKKPKKYHLTF